LLEGLGNVVVKEVKELIRDPKILIGVIIIPVLLFPLMGLAVRVSMESAVESAKKISLGVMNQDVNGNFSRDLVNFLIVSNVTVVNIETTNETEAIRLVQESNMTALVIIPTDFSYNITNDLGAKLKIYAVFRGTGIAESAGSSAITALVDAFGRIIALEKTGNPNRLNPISPLQQSIVKGHAIDVTPSVLFGLVMSQYIGMPIGIIMLIVFAMQIAATSVASEKEEKTLETLLTMPIHRFTILVGKLAGSVIVAAIGALAYVVGFNYYMGSFTAAFPTQAGIDLATLGLAPTMSSFIVLGASLFVTLVSALALAIAISSFAEDVRSAQTTVGYLYFVLFIPMLFMMYSDIGSLPMPLRIILLAIPYTHPMLAARAAFTGDYTIAVLGIAYVSIFTVVVLYIAAKIFTTEKILTMKLRLRRQKTKKEE
jgi:ABC-2 type transport system permease protein